jgi:hypothetical protein
LWTLLVALIAVAVFIPAVGYDLVYDSYTQVLVDPFVHTLSHFWDVITFRVLGMDVLDFNRPVNLLTLMLDSILWGKNPGGYHLTSILLHAAAVGLLFRFVRHLTGSSLASAVATAIFAIHPLQIEAVVEVGNREDILATLFTLAALNFATAFRPGEDQPKRWCIFGGLTLLSTILAIGSKESAVALPPILGIYWYLFRRKEPRAPWFILIAACALACAAFLALRFGLEPKNSAIFLQKPGRIYANAFQWLQIQTRIFGAEFTRILWPRGLCADYNGYSIMKYSVWLCAVFLLGIIALQVAGSRWLPLIALGTAVFWFPLLPVSNLIPIYRPMADRFLYMPLAGVTMMLAPVLAKVRPQTIVAVVALPILGMLGICTLQEEQVWKDRMTLWTVTNERTTTNEGVPTSYNACLGIGYASLDNNHPQEAALGFRNAINCSRGKAAEPFAALAITLDKLQMHEQAVQLYRHAIGIDPKFANPDQLVSSLVFTPLQAQELQVIALRSKRI